MKRFLIAALLALSVCAQAVAEQRIVSLLPSDTEILFALKASSVVAVSNFCNYPPEAAKLEKAGDLYNPNIEKILSLKPDIVITGKWKSSPAAQRLKRAGINVLEIPDADSIATIYSSIKDIGAATGRKAQAKELVASIKARIAAAARHASKSKLRVYVEVDSQHWTVGKGTYINDMLQTAGGVNIFADLKEPYAKVSWESVVARNPDIIISFTPQPVDFTKLPDADKITAVAKGRMISGLDKDIFVRPSPRVAQAVEILVKTFNEAAKK
jgi:iron complex transport system substrate-binding protein